MPSSRLVARFRAIASGERARVIDDGGRSSGASLADGALRVAAALRGDGASLEGARVALLVSPGAAWVEAFFGVLLAGGVVVPLSPLHPAPELAYFLADADASCVVVSPDLADRAGEVAGERPVRAVAELRAADAREPAETTDDDAALMLYTSGTTGKPKGAVLSHGAVATQTELLAAAWGLGEHDTLVHALPLHHLHGVVIALLSTLLAGGAARMLPRFEAAAAWSALDGATVWMAVPTMYQRMLEARGRAADEQRARWDAAARGLRLATSGSAALPVGLAEAWRELAGRVPLERYGMTEIGVGCSNPLDGERVPGSIGRALPTVELRIVDEAGADVRDGEPGELWIRGPSLFSSYFRRDEATRDAFTDGWFRTGDVGTRDARGYVRLLGRSSTDILKSGGYKLSALEIEEALREHPAIAEVAVVGVPDEAWGDEVVAVVVAREGAADACATDAVRAWAKERLAPYKVPRRVVVVDALPRNAMGKVQKPELSRKLAARG